MNEKLTTKTRRQCGIVKLISAFGKHSKSSDGYKHICNECYDKNWHEGRFSKKSVGGKSDKLNPELATFTPRQLMVELNARGYVGKLQYVQIIDIEKL